MEQSLGTKFTDKLKDEKFNNSKAFTVPADDAKAIAESAIPKIKEQLVNFKAQAGKKLETATDFVKDHPVACVAGATAVGYLVGRMFTRKQ